MTEAVHAISLLEPVVLLAAAVLVVPVAKRLELGSVLGYIAAGIAVGSSRWACSASRAGFPASRNSASSCCCSSSDWH